MIILPSTGHLIRISATSSFLPSNDQQRLDTYASVAIDRGLACLYNFQNGRSRKTRWRSIRPTLARLAVTRRGPRKKRGRTDVAEVERHEATANRVRYHLMRYEREDARRRTAAVSRFFAGTRSTPAREERKKENESIRGGSIREKRYTNESPEVGRDSSSSRRSRPSNHPLSPSLSPCTVCASAPVVAPQRSPTDVPNLLAGTWALRRDPARYFPA